MFNEKIKNKKSHFSKKRRKFFQLTEDSIEYLKEEGSVTAAFHNQA